MSSYSASWPAFTIAMSSPAWIAWYRNAEWIASRTRSLPRNLKDRFDSAARDLRAGAASP